MKRSVYVFISLALLLGVSAPAGAQMYENPVLSKQERMRALLKHRWWHLGAVTVVKLNDAYKWQKKLDQAERYAKKNEPSPVVSASGHKLFDGRGVFALKTRSGQTGWLEISFPFENTVRVRAGLDEPPQPDQSGMRTDVKEEADAVLVTAGEISVRINRGPFRLSFFRDGGPLLEEPAGQGAFAGLELGKGLCRQSFLPAKDERFMGGGEQYARVNHRGRVLIMDTDDAYQSTSGNTYIPVPFILSSRRYGLLVNTYRKARFDLGERSDESLFFENPGPSIDYYLFLSKDPKEIIQDQSKITGPTHLVPRWSLEPWISRRTWIGWRYDKGAAHDVDTMIEQGFPLGVVMWENLTMTSHRGVDFRVNRETKPGAPELIEKWHELGIKVAGYHRAASLRYNPETLEYYGFDKHPEHLVRNPDGTIFIGGRGGDKFYIDVTSPEALEYAWENVYKPVFLPAEDPGFLSMDLDGTKIDFGEYFPPDDVPLTMAHRRPGMRLYQPVYFSEWLYNRINRTRPEGGITWVRGAAMGAQRTGIVWAGDRGRTFPQFRTTLIAGINAAASGVTLWGTDLGGYCGGGLRAEEVYNRAVAFSCFSPSFHDHGHAIAPWEQTERGKDIYRFYARLRYNLIPYLYHYVWEAHGNGLPVVRPLPIECPGDRTCWDVEDQYLLGDDLLVAPVVEHATERRVYLPAGEWLDFWTGEESEGPAWIQRAAPRETIPVFVRKGSAIPVELPAELEPGGAFAQADKDSLTPGFLVFAGPEFEIKGEWKVKDPRVHERVESALELSRSGGEIRVGMVSPGSGALVIYGPEPEEVLDGQSQMKRTSCEELVKGDVSCWCYRGSDRATLIRFEG